MKTWLLVGSTSLLLALGTIAVATWQGLEASPAHADPTLVVGLDMDPTGNFCSGSAIDCTLGDIDQCVSVANTEGLEFDIDLFIQGLTNGFLLWNENLNFPDTELIVQADDQTNAAFVLTAQAVGSNVSPYSETTPGPPGR